MKILIHGLNFSPEIVGIGKYTGELAEALVKHGHQVVVVTTPPYYPQWKIEKEYSNHGWQIENNPNLKIIRCPIYVPKKVTGLGRILLLLSFALTSSLALLRESRAKYDLIFAIEPTLFSAPFTLFASKRCHALSWLHVQDFEIDAALELGIFSSNFFRNLALNFELQIYRKFDMLSTISQRMIERLMIKAVPVEKIRFFPNWVNHDEIYPLTGSNQYRQKLGIKSEKIVILYSGSLGLKQGIEVIIEIAKRLKSNSEIKFVICGDGPTKPALIRMAEGLDNIYFLPLQPLNNLNELLNMADIHILPQKSNASDLVMPSKLLGILASGKPVIAGCIAESELFNIVNEVGISVKPEDATEFIKAIEFLVFHADKRIMLGKKGRELAIKDYSKTTVINRFINEIERIHKT